MRCSTGRTLPSPSHPSFIPAPPYQANTHHEKWCCNSTASHVEAKFSKATEISVKYTGMHLHVTWYAGPGHRVSPHTVTPCPNHCVRVMLPRTRPSRQVADVCLRRSNQSTSTSNRGEAGEGQSGRAACGGSGDQPNTNLCLYMRVCACCLRHEVSFPSFSRILSLGLLAGGSGQPSASLA